MCGIAGYFGFPPLIKDNFACDALSHRGPDDSGVFVDPHKGVHLFHTRLSIQDLTLNGHQPMVSDDGSKVLVFNGEIYNFIELREELLAKGVCFKGNSDTEVLLHLYEAEGESMLARLNGIFSFAIWDAQLNMLLIVRDPLGVKPLYYVQETKFFAFASEIKALLPWINAGSDLDEKAIHSYLTFLWCPGKRTPFQNVRKVMPGEAIEIQDTQVKRRWFWSKLPIFHSKKTLDMNRGDAISGTRKYLKEAVVRQMVADVPVGAFLSGGLDSSAIVAFAREYNESIKCFTIEANGGQETGVTDDLPYARRVAQHLGVHLEVVPIDASLMAGDLERMVWQLDEPLADPAALNVLYISKLAREQGIKVLLSGSGGDDLFTGYRRHQALMLEHWWSWMPLSVRSMLTKLSDKIDNRSVLGRRVAKLFSGADLDGDARLINYFRWAKRADLEGLYTKEFRAKLCGWPVETEMVEFLHDLPADTSSLERLLALEQRFFLADHNLLYTDKMSMAVGVEVRVPFLDKDLVEFASNVPNRFKQRGKHGKWVLKKAMEPYLPQDVIYRPKSGFGAPVRRWIKTELRDFVGEILSEESLQERGIFDFKAVQQLILSNDAGRIDASYTLLSLLCIEIWCRKFIDQNQTVEITF